MQAPLPSQEGHRVELRTHAAPGTVRLRAFAYLLGVPLVFVSIISSYLHRRPLTPAVLLIALAVSAAIPTIVLPGVEDFSWVRHVEATTNGISFRFRFHSRFVPWDRLSPAKYPAYRGVWYLIGCLPDGRRLPFPATVEQARMIVASPWHHTWELGPIIRESIALKL